MAIYGPKGMTSRGSTVCLNVLGPDGLAVPYLDVETRAREQGLAIRGGCFCNPGAAERAFGFSRFDVEKCLDDLGDAFTVEAFQRGLGPQSIVGGVRFSLGLPTNHSDLDRAVTFLGGFAA